MGTTETKKMRVGVVGCGAISDIYLTNMIHNFENLEVAACCAGHLEHAKKKAEQYGIKGCTYEEILADPSIEMVVILTPAPTHEGLIGEVTSFEACANRDLDLLASIFRFLRMPGGGICYDFGVYYLTAIVSLFGPVDRVVSSVRNLAAKRVNIIPGSPEYGQEFDYTNESQVFTILEMKNGVTGTFCVNGDSVINDQAVFTIYGKKGILKLVDPNNFGGDVVYIPGVKDWTQQTVPEVLHYGFDYSENSRGLGPSEMAEAIAEGRPNRASAKMAYHVLDTIDQIMKSAETGAFEKVPSTCERPEAMPNS